MSRRTFTHSAVLDVFLILGQCQSFALWQQCQDYVLVLRHLHITLNHVASIVNRWMSMFCNIISEQRVCVVCTRFEILQHSSVHQMFSAGLYFHFAV